MTTRHYHFRGRPDIARIIDEAPEEAIVITISGERDGALLARASYQDMEAIGEPLDEWWGAEPVFRPVVHREAGWTVARGGEAPLPTDWIARVLPDADGAELNRTALQLARRLHELRAESGKVYVGVYLPDELTASLPPMPDDGN